MFNCIGEVNYIYIIYILQLLLLNIHSAEGLAKKDVFGLRLVLCVHAVSKGVSSPHRGREGMQLQACAVDYQKL